MESLVRCPQHNGTTNSDTPEQEDCHSASSGSLVELRSKRFLRNSTDDADCRALTATVSASLSGKSAARTSSQSSDQAGVQSQPNTAISASESEPLLMGFQSFDALDSIDLPAYVDEHNATLSFPEKLMLMLMHIEQEYAKSGKRESEAPIGWVLDGRAFGIYNKDGLVSAWLPMFFRQAKYSSFTRKLYRWGFRQVTIDGDAETVSTSIKYFGNENFQRQRKALLSNMRSVTAAGTRREEAAQSIVDRGPKKTIEPAEDATRTAPVSSIVESTGLDAASSNHTCLPVGLQNPFAISYTEAFQIPTLHAAIQAFSQSNRLPLPSEIAISPDISFQANQALAAGILGSLSPQVNQPQPWMIQHALSTAQALVAQHMAQRQLFHLPQDTATNQYLLNLSRITANVTSAGQQMVPVSQAPLTSISPAPSNSLLSQLPAESSPQQMTETDRLRALVEVFLRQQSSRANGTPAQPPLD